MHIFPMPVTFLPVAYNYNNFFLAVSARLSACQVFWGGCGLGMVWVGNNARYLMYSVVRRLMIYIHVYVT